LLRRLDELRRDGWIDYRAGREAWLITTEGAGHRIELRPTVALGAAERESVLAERLVLCPGGQDRQLPVPGWDLPGVMAAGGVQSLLKGQHTLAGRRVAVAGTGPFLLPVATGLARAGAEVVAICEANAPSGWLRSAAAVTRVPSKIIEGAGYAAKLIRHRIPYRTRTIVGAVRGQDRVEAVRLDRIDRAGRVTKLGIADLEVDAVAFGWGFTPALELIMMVGAGTELGPDGSLITTVDAAQRATVPGVYVAGEACGVGGAALAVAEGDLAARTLLRDRDRIADATPTGLLRRIRRQRAFATAMHRAHPVPAGWPDWCAADTMLCRCEEVTVGTATYAATELGAASARDQKLLTRCGMGWCQARICGSAVAGLTARLAGRDVTADDLRAMGKRTFAIPVPLSELAHLSDPVEEQR
jgi:NADP-dependent aldehyde dehydrogenase